MANDRQINFRYSYNRIEQERVIITAKNKERLLFLLRYLMDHTDEDNECTLNDLVTVFKENGTPATIKTIRNDLEKLKESGFEISENTDTGKPTYYSYKQSFNGADLKMIIDAVSAAKFISQRDCNELVSKLISLANINATKELFSDTDPGSHHETPNRNLYGTIMVILAAKSEGKKISYQYYDYGIDKSRVLHNNGEVYVYSPYGFAWNEDRYYLLGRVDKRPDVINPVRVDLMCNVKILDEDALPAPANFAAKQYSEKVFGMFGGEEADVVLEAENGLMKKFIDRFGDSFAVSKVSDQAFRATVRVSISPTFFSWVFQYDGRVKIISPSDVTEQYSGMLERLLAYYGKLSVPQNEETQDPSGKQDGV